MNNAELYKIFEKMKERMTPERLLEELFQAMSTDEMKANLEHISDGWDLRMFDEEENE